MLSPTRALFDWDPAITLKSHDYAKTGKWTTRAAMLALEHPDPALQLPAQAVLHPQLFLHNIANRPVEAQLSLHWRSVQSGLYSDGRVLLPAIKLAPLETRVVDIKQLEDAGTVPATASWAQVTLTTDSLPGEVVAVASSFDDSLRYGAQTPFSDQLAFHLEGGSWRVDANHDSIIAAGNGSGKPVKARLTFFYAGGAERYEMERTIAADDQMWVDMGELIRDGVPDVHGNVLPRDLTTGAYQLLNLEAAPAPVLYEGKVVTDKTYGHATYGCMICCGYRGVQLNPNPILTFTGGFAGFNPVGTNACGGGTTNLNGYAQSWWTDDPGIMTANQGQATGVSMGSTNLYADMPDLPLRGILDGGTCPVGDTTASGPGTVQVPTALKAIATTSNGAASCPTGQSGWQRVVTRGVIDQLGQAIQIGNQSVGETLTLTQTGLGNGPIATGTGLTDASGQYPDTFSICSSLCPGGSPSTNTATQTNTDTLPNGGTTYNLTNSTIQYACTYIKLNGALTP